MGYADAWLAVAETEPRKDAAGGFARDQSHPEAAGGENGGGPTVEAGAISFVVELLGAS